MKRMLFLVLAAGCVLGRTRSLVEHSSTLPDGSERKVVHSTWGVGAFPPSPGASAGEVASADLATVQASEAEAWGKYCRSAAGLADWRCLGYLGGLYGNGGFYGGVPLTGAPLVGGYTAAGNQLAQGLAGVVSRATNYTVIQGQTVWDADAGAQAPEGAPPEPEPPASAPADAPTQAAAPPEPDLACVPPDTGTYLEGRVKEMDRLLRESNPDRTRLNSLLHEVDTKLKEAEEACAGNSTALTELDKKREEIYELRKRINALEVKR